MEENDDAVMHSMYLRTKINPQALAAWLNNRVGKIKDYRDWHELNPDWDYNETYPDNDSENNNIFLDEYTDNYGNQLRFDYDDEGGLLTIKILAASDNWIDHANLIAVFRTLALFMHDFELMTIIFLDYLGGDFEASAWLTIDNQDVVWNNVENVPKFLIEEAIAGLDLE